MTTEVILVELSECRILGAGGGASEDERQLKSTGCLRAGDLLSQIRLLQRFRHFLDLIRRRLIDVLRVDCGLRASRRVDLDSEPGRPMRKTAHIRR